MKESQRGSLPIKKHYPNADSKEAVAFLEDKFEKELILYERGKAEEWIIARGLLMELRADRDGSAGEY